MQDQVGMSSDSDENDDLFDGVEVEIDEEIPQFEQEQSFKKKIVSTKSEIQPQFKQNVIDYSKSESIKMFEQKTSEKLKSGPNELLATSLDNSENKKVVRFESKTETKRPQSAVLKQSLEIAGQNDGPKTVTQKLLNIEQEIKKNITGKPISEIKLLLGQYCMLSNEEAQNFDLSDPNQQKKALAMLDQCINVIKLVQDDQNPFDELHYETLNNIARCYNFSGNIKQSLNYLLKAFKHVQRLQRKQEQGSVTIMPELSLNICNAYIYENNSLEAVNYADVAIKSSNECIKVLSKKIDKKVDAQSKDKSQDPKKLVQLFQSQIQLHIQGYQAKGKIMEKMNRYREAIKQYNHAKVVVEQNFGTNHQLFKDIVNQVSAANVNLKTQNYQGRSSSSLKSSSFKSMKRIGTGISKQATSAQSPDKMLVQFSEDTIDIRSVGGNSDFGQNSLMSTPSNHTEQQKKNRKQLVSGKSQKSLKSERKSSLENGNKIRQERSRRPKQKINDINMMQYINQPPFNAGFPSAGFNRFNHIQNVNRSSDQWKFNRYYTPNMLGALGYNFYNLDRKNCFYHTPIGQQRTIKKKIIVKERRQISNAPTQQPVVVQQSNRDYDSKLDIYLKEMQIKQQEQQRIMIDTINKQKENMIEYQRLERERAKQEREKFLVQLQQLSSVQITSIKKTETKIVAEQRPQLPPVHPIFGPAVYDEKGKFWFYKQKEIKPRAPSPKKIKMITSQIQTDEAPKIQIQEMALQTDDFQFEIKQPGKPIQIQKPKRMDYEKAVYIIQKFFKKQGLIRREIEFYDQNHGVLLDRKYNYNKYQECIEIMSMYAVPSIDNFCNCLKFSIFNYALKKYTYLGIFDKFFTLKQYTVSQLLNLSKQKLKAIEFENNPFKNHVLCIQQILNDQRKQKNVVLVKKGDVIEEVIEGPGEIVIDVEEKPAIDEKMIQTEEQKIIIKFYQFEEQIIKIQRWFSKKYKKIVIIKHSLALKRDKEILATVPRIEYYRGSKKHFIIQLIKINHQKDDSFFYQLIAREIDQVKLDYIQIKKVKYHNIRLPDDKKVLHEYVKEGVVLELDQKDGKIEKLQLLRLMVDPKPIHATGCLLIKEFPLINYKKHICKIYKRYRWEDEKTKKQIAKDWKIKVIQEDQPNSEDYIVVRRLPCEVSHIDIFIQESLEVIPNRRVIPNSILHLQWKVKNLLVKSQKYYDLNSSRLKHIYQSTWYFSQYSPTVYKIPNQSDIENKYYAPFYEIYVQKMVPKSRDAKPIRYKTQKYANYKEEKRKKKYGKYYKNKRGGNSPSSSESEDDDNPEKYQDENSNIFWDEQLLIKMQLDEVTEAREYYKITVTRTSDKQDTDFFRIEKDVVKWPHPDVEFQYLMQNLSLKQMQNKVTGEWNIEVIGLKIRKNEEKFISDTVWKQSLDQDMETEQFMSQDMNRWRNQNFACTVYNREKHGKDYLVEAINVDHPNQRAYLRIPDLSQIRGKLLKDFIDEKLRIIGKKEQDQKALLIADQQFGFGSDFIIEKIEFLSTPEEYKIENQFNTKYLDVELEEKLEDHEDQKYEDIKAAEKEELKEKEDFSTDQWTKFSLLNLPNPKFKKKVEINVEIRINKNPQFFKVVITNSLNTKTGSDTQTIKIQKLPEPLTIKENNIQKIQDIFNQKLKIIWMDQREWADPTIPQILDAFIENTIMKEQIIQKLIEVKVWDDYHKKIEEKGSSDSDEIDATDQELILVRQDVFTIKQLLKQIRTSLISTDGILKFFEKFDNDGTDQIDLEQFKKMISGLNINLEIRLIIMLYLVFDRSYQGFFQYKDFEDIIQKRIKLKLKRLVHIERTRFRKNGTNINLPEKKKKPLKMDHNLQDNQSPIKNDKN